MRNIGKETVAHRTVAEYPLIRNREEALTTLHGKDIFMREFRLTYRFRTLDFISGLF
jgi:hypothetical protein